MAQRMMACLAIAALTGAVSCADSPVAPSDTVTLTVAPATDSVLLTYICGNMFRVRNTSFDAREVRWDIYNAVPADTGSLRLRGRDVGAAHVDYFVTSRTKGTMRLFVGGVLRQTKANGNKVGCAAPVDTSPLPTQRTRWTGLAAEPTATDAAGNVVARTIMSIMFNLPLATAIAQRTVLRSLNAQIVRVHEPGFYYVRIVDPGVSPDSLAAIVARVGSMQGVKLADFVPVRETVTPSGGARFPTDGAGARRQDYLSGSSATWPAIRTRLNTGWWCENGTYSAVRTPIAIVESNFPDTVATDLDGNVTVYRAPVDSGDFPSADTAKARREHGLAVTGVLAAKGDNQLGLAGVLWRTSTDVYSLSQVGWGKVKNGIDYFDSAIVPQLLLRRPRVLSLSTEFTPSSTYSTAQKLTYQRLVYLTTVTLLDSLPSLLIVKSANNDGFNDSFEKFNDSKRGALATTIAFLVSQPAYSTRVLLVGATNSSGSRANFSNHISGRVEIYAPGANVPVLRPGDVVGSESGTSFATPLVAGIAGQLLTMDPSLSPADVKQLILDGARDSVENPSGVNALPAKVGGIQDTVYEADYYGSLRLLSARAGTPLCGAQLRPWSNEPDNLSVIFNSTRAVRYQSGIQENLPDFSLSQQSLAPGGRLFAGMSSHLMSFANGFWQTYVTVPDSARRLFGERDTLTYIVPGDPFSQPIVQLRLLASAGAWSLNPAAASPYPFKAHQHGLPSLSPAADRVLVPLTSYGNTFDPNLTGIPLTFRGSSLEILSANPVVSLALPAAGSRYTLADEGRTAWDPRGTRAVFYTVSVDSLDTSTQSYRAQITILSFSGASVNATTAPLEPGRWPISAAWSDEGERLTLIDAAHSRVPFTPFVDPFTDCRIRNYHVTSSRALVQISSASTDQRSCTPDTAFDRPFFDLFARVGAWCLEWSPCQRNSGGNGDGGEGGGGDGEGGGAAGRVVHARSGTRVRSTTLSALRRLCERSAMAISSQICRTAAGPIVPGF
jgi:Subtilase family